MPHPRQNFLKSCLFGRSFNLTEWLLMSLTLCTLFTLHNAVCHSLSRPPLHTYIYMYIFRPLPHEAYICFFSKVSIQCSSVKTCQVFSLFIFLAGFTFSDRCQVLNEFLLADFNCQLSHSHWNSTI